MKKKIVVAIYIRVSTAWQAEDGYSLDAQERVLLEYCAAKNYQVYKIYRDDGISAKDIVHRPGMVSLLNDASEEKFDAILVWKLTRFTRNLADLTTVCDKLDRIGVTLISYSEAFDSCTPAGRMVRSMLGTVAQFEREVISENVKLGMLERARQGKRTCSAILGYDLDGKDSLKINDEEARNVRIIYDQYVLRKSLTEVRDVCAEMEIHGKRGSKLDDAWRIETILTRPLYAGYNVYCGKLYKGIHPSIITVSQYNKVQRIIMRQSKISGRTRKRPLYILPDNSA